MGVTAEELQACYKANKAKYDGVKEDYFAPLYLADKFDKPIEKVFDNCAFGANDYGIDGYYIDRDTRILYLYQFKWSESHELFKDSYKRLIKEGIERIFGDPQIDSKVNLVINRLKSDLDEAKAIIDRVFICFIFNGDVEKAEASKVLESLREDLESKKHFIDSYFNRENTILQIQYISNETRKTNLISRVRKTYSYEIKFSSTSSKLATGGELMHLGFIKMYDLYKMYTDMKLRLFEKNIRAGLSDDLAPNQSIKKNLKEIVLQGKTSPEYFTFHHNGVTLYAEKIEFKDDGTVHIVEPRVLNGAQSITTYARFIEDSQKNPALSENRKKLESIEVIGKIITNCSPEFVTQITISNNKQNPVEPWNLRANDLIQCEFEEKFLDGGIYYERQENAFENLTEDELEEMGIAQTKDVKIKKLAQTLLAFQGEIDKISNIKAVFENDSIYHKTFNPNYIRSDLRRIVLGYKIQFRLNKIIEEIISKGENKYNWVRAGRNLIWSLMIQALLNDDKLDTYLEDYGNTISIDSGFNLLLKEIASKKIRFILSDLISMKSYSNYIQEDKYNFLKTKIAFQDCMMIAKRKYYWERIQLND